MKHLADVDDESRVARQANPGLLERHLGATIAEWPRIPAFDLALREEKDSAPRLDGAPQLNAKHGAGVPVISRQQIEPVSVDQPSTSTMP